MRTLTENAISVLISCECSARAEGEELLAEAGAPGVAEAVQQAEAGVVPVAEARVALLVVAVGRVEVQRAARAVEPAAEAELPGVVVLRAGAAVLPAAGMPVDLVAILISTT